jgi:hypothetical protein
VVNQLLEYYPADPSAGSPYNTGNNTFDKAVQYKRAASVVGDLLFEVSDISLGWDQILMPKFYLIRPRGEISSKLLRL